MKALVFYDESGTVDSVPESDPSFDELVERFDGWTNGYAWARVEEDAGLTEG